MAVSDVRAIESVQVVRTSYKCDSCATNLGSGVHPRGRLTGCIFHTAAPRRRCLGANERASAYPHYDRCVATFRQIVEMCTADSVSAAEFGDRECEHIRQERLLGGLTVA